MWSCRLCLQKTRKRANVIRHLKLVHDIDDRDGKNAIKDSNKAIGMISYGDDGIEFSDCSKEIKQPLRMNSSGRPISEESSMSEENQFEEASHMKEKESHRPQPRMEKYGDYEEETSRCQPRSITELAKELTKDQFERIGATLKAKKSTILDCVMKILPNNMKPRAKCICDKFNNTDRVWLNDKQKLIIDGDVISKSNVCTHIKELLTSFPSSGESSQSTQSDVSTKIYKIAKSITNNPE